MSLSSELKPLILYDIPCTTLGRPWSPNTMKTRYCLGYKQLPFITTWIEMPDIAGLLRSKGITDPPYTLPAIEDPNTGAVVVDSLAIATYLDETYPGTPNVLSPAARAALDRVGDSLSFGFRGGTIDPNSVVDNRGMDILVFLVINGERLNPVSKAYYFETRATRLGDPWTNMLRACSASPEERAASVHRGIQAIEGRMRKLLALYDRHDDSEEGKSAGPYVLGQEPCFLDFAIAGRIKFFLEGLGPSEMEILEISTGGKLSQLVENLEKYFKY